LSFRRRTAQHGPHAGDELSHAVRLGHIVVGTDLEADDGVDLARLGRDHDDRRPVAPGANGPAHVDTRDPWQHDVEQDQVRSDGAELIERFGTVTGHLHPEAFTLQAYDKGVDKRRFVLDDEDGHLLRHWPAPAARLKEREMTKVGPPSSPARR
jgi:hypothetical protein